jgi:lipoyl(octanoyl) transferase
MTRRVAVINLGPREPRGARWIGKIHGNVKKIKLKISNRSASSVYSEFNQLNTRCSGCFVKELDPVTKSGFLYDGGLMPYVEAWAWQQVQVADRKRNPQLPDAFMLVEHPPVYTLGQGSDPGFLKFDPETSPYELHRIERGGEVTYHAPGQLVGYPILNLAHHQQDLHWYLRQLEEVVIRSIAHYGVTATRSAGLTGVWIEDRKVAAIGIKVSRWITMHGFALNVCPDLSGFDRIVPCGLTDTSVGSLAQWIPGLTVDQVKPIVVQAFEAVFEMELCPIGSSIGSSIVNSVRPG